VDYVTDAASHGDGPPVVAVRGPVGRDSALISACADWLDARPKTIIAREGASVCASAARFRVAKGRGIVMSR
jgi:hypothetical protein